MATDSERPSELRYVKIAEIKTDEQFNPRSAVDEQGLAELTESIKRRGILQPLLARRDDDGDICLVAGHRRLAAARAAGLDRVPLLIATDGHDAFEDAITENLQRQDLRPVEEARALERAQQQGGLNQKALAERLGKSPAYVRDRLRLLRLPAQAQGAIDVGQIPVSAAKPLERIAKVSTQVAEACVGLIQAGHVEAPDFERDPARAVAMIERVEWKEDRPVAVATHARRQPGELPLGERAEEIVRRWEALPGDGYGYRPGFSLQGEVDAARAYGCLLEFKDQGYYGAQAFICDAQVIADRCLVQLERLEREAKERAEREARRRQEGFAAAGVDADSDGAVEKAEAELRRQEREREREEEIAARGANLDLGARLGRRFHRPKLTKDMARLLALLVLDRDADAYAARGLRYVEPKLQDTEVRELKSGQRKEKVTYADRDTCAAYLVERLGRARSAEEIVGLVLQTVIAAHFADERVTAKSHRIGFSLPGSHGYYYDGGGPALAARREIPALVEKIARPALPQRMREQLGARKARRREAEREEEVVGRDAEGAAVTRGEVVAHGEPLTEETKRAFEETAGAAEWSAPAEDERKAA
jgi:ParB/RepB/Spo0J family partition protein